MPFDHCVQHQIRTALKYANMESTNEHVHCIYMTSIGAAQEHNWMERNVYTSTMHTNRKRKGESHWNLNGKIQWKYEAKKKQGDWSRNRNM